MDEDEQERLRAEAEALRAYARKLHQRARLLREEAKRIADQSDAMMADCLESVPRSWKFQRQMKDG